MSDVIVYIAAYYDIDKVNREKWLREITREVKFKDEQEARNFIGLLVYDEALLSALESDSDQDQIIDALLRSVELLVGTSNCFDAFGRHYYITEGWG